MLETHPFGSFVPKNSRYLLLGSFPGTSGKDNLEYWFYGTKTTQFWSILENVYGVKLQNRKSKEKLLRQRKMAISDIIYKCERKSGNSLDTNLTNITYNNKIIEKILRENRIEKIYFTSRFVENKYRTKFKYLIEKYPDIELITLPSPSPRYAAMKKEEKIKRYKALLPMKLLPQV